MIKAFSVIWDKETETPKEQWLKQKWKLTSVSHRSPEVVGLGLV